MPDDVADTSPNSNTVTLSIVSSPTSIATVVPASTRAVPPATNAPTTSAANALAIPAAPANTPPIFKKIKKDKYLPYTYTPIHVLLSIGPSSCLCGE